MASLPLPRRGWFSNSRAILRDSQCQSNLSTTVSIPATNVSEPMIKNSSPCGSHSPMSALEPTPKTPILVSFTLDNRLVCSSPGSPIEGLCSTRRAEISPLNLAGSSPLMEDYPSLTPESSVKSRATGSMSPIPPLDISGAATEVDGLTTPLKSQLRSSQSRGPSSENLPLVNHSLPSTPKDFLFDYAAFPAIPSLSDSEFSFTAHSASGKFQSPSMCDSSSLPSSDSYPHQEDPCERLHTLASLAVTQDMALDGDVELGCILSAARNHSVQSREFAECVNYLSRVDFSHVIEEWRRARAIRNENIGSTDLTVLDLPWTGDWGSSDDEDFEY